jgi:deoxyribose-phosphate aldolase
LKAIVESSVLDKDQLLDATILVCMAGADYIKTSTGWNGGASVEHVKLMRSAAELCGRGTKIKASGGLKTADDAVRMLKAGAHRIGTSSGVQIMKKIDEGESLKQGAGHATA